MQARVDNVQNVQLQVVHGNTHAGRDPGHVRALELDTHPLIFFEHQQVEFGALVGCPKIRLVGLGYAQDLFQGKAFPAGTTLRMRKQFSHTTRT